MTISKARNRDYHNLREAALEERGASSEAAVRYVSHRLMLEDTYEFDALRDDLSEKGEVLRGELSNSERQMVAVKTGRRFVTKQQDRKDG